jgi:RIO-like serine/threonine protein kinase
MTLSRTDLVGPSRFVSDTIGDLIGFGSFAAVYSHKSDKSLVIKLSRYGAKAVLEREADVQK